MIDITFSISRYDYEGDKVEDGIYLHFGDTCVKVADSPSEAPQLLEQIRVIVEEIGSY